jgi:hypothetical protein
MKKNFQMLKELLDRYCPEQKGIVSWSEYKLIHDTLYVGEMDILQLRNLRDFVVLYLDRDADREDWDRMSAITHVIDSRISYLGGEV